MRTSFKQVPRLLKTILDRKEGNAGGPSRTVGVSSVCKRHVAK